MCVTGILDDFVLASDLARRATVIRRTRAQPRPQRHPPPSTVRPHVDARRLHPQPQERPVSHYHRPEPADPTVSGRYDPVQPASDVDSVVRHDPQQVPDGQPDVQDRAWKL